ncbi:alpha-tocopherol transfer protein-like [Glandiceps talaboti]
MAVANTYTCTLSAESLDKAKRELKEDPDTRQQQLDKLRKLFDSRPDIKFRLDDEFLLRYLRCKKFEPERAFKTLVHYYEVRRDYKEVFNNFVPSAVADILAMKVHYLSAGRDNDGRRVFLFKPGVINADKHGILPAIRASIMFMEKILEEEETQVNGIVAISDVVGMTMSHVTSLGPNTARKVADVFQNALPLRMKAIHYVNQPKIFDTMFALIKPFLGDKLKKRIHFHGEEFGTLHEYVPSSTLPTEYGGSIPEFSNQKWNEALLASEDAFVENNSYGFPRSAESLGGSNIGEDPATGLKGTFKKLEM